MNYTGPGAFPGDDSNTSVKDDESPNKYVQPKDLKTLSVAKIVKQLILALEGVGTKEPSLQKIAKVVQSRGTEFMQDVAKAYKNETKRDLRKDIIGDFSGDNEDMALNAFGFATEGNIWDTHQESHAGDKANIPNFEAYGIKTGTEIKEDAEYDPDETGSWYYDKSDATQAENIKTLEKSYYDDEVNSVKTAQQEAQEEKAKKDKPESPADREQRINEEQTPAAPTAPNAPQPTPVESNRIRSRDPKTGPGPRIEQNPITPRKTQPNRSRFEDERVSRTLQQDENREILRDARRQRTEDNMYDTLQAVLDSLNSGGNFNGINVDGWSNADKAREYFKGITDPDQLDRTQLNNLRKWREFNLKDIPDNSYKGDYRDGYKVGSDSQGPVPKAGDPRFNYGGPEMDEAMPPQKPNPKMVSAAEQKAYEEDQAVRNEIIVPGQGEAGGAIPPEFNSEAEYMRSLMEDPLEGGGAAPAEESPKPQEAKGGDVRSQIEEFLKNERDQERKPNPRNPDGTIPLFGEDGVARDPSGLAFPGQTPSLDDPEPATGSSDSESFSVDTKPTSKTGQGDSESFSVDTKPTSDTPGGPRKEYLEPKAQEAFVENNPEDFEFTEDGIVDNRPKGPGVQTLPYKPPSMDEIGRSIGMIKDPPVGTDTVLRPADQMGDIVTPSKPVTPSDPYVGSQNIAKGAPISGPTNYQDSVNQAPSRMTQIPSVDSNPAADLPPPPPPPSQSPTARDNPYASPTARFDDGYFPPLPEGMEIPDGTQRVYPEGSLTQPEDFPTHSDDIEIAQNITDQETFSPQPAPTRAPSVEDPEPEYYPVQGPIRARDNPNATPEQKMLDDSFTQQEMEPRLRSARAEGRRRNDEEFAQQDLDEFERMITGRHLTEPSRYGEGDYKSNLKADPSELVTQNEGLIDRKSDGSFRNNYNEQMMPVYGANGLIGYKAMDPALIKKRQEGTLKNADRVQFDDPMAGGAATDALRLQEAYKNSKSATPHLDMKQDLLRMSRMGQAEKDQYYRERMAKLHGVGVHGSELEQNMRNPNYNPLSTAEMPSVNFDNLQETGRMLQADRMHPGHNLQTPEQQAEEDLARRGIYRPGSTRDLRTLGFSDPDITMMKQNELRQKNKKQDSPRILNSFV